jgi:anaerobic selenocysteine-containing dehydrogenase
LQLARPVLPAPGDAKSNVEVFRLLAERLGFQEPCFRDSEDDMIRTLLDSAHPFLRGITLERLEREHSVRLSIAPDGEAYLPFAHGGFGTRSGKCEFGAEALDYQPPVESRLGSAELRSRFPLELVSAKSHDSMNSTFGNAPWTQDQTSMLFLHDDDARPRGIASGDRVRVFNDRGSCTLLAGVNGVVRQGVVLAPSVRWNKLSPDHRNVNVLTSDRLTDIGGGPTFFSCLVDVEKCGD